MIFLLNNTITPTELNDLKNLLDDKNFRYRHLLLNLKQVLIIYKFPQNFDIQSIAELQGVAKIIDVKEPYKLASKQWQNNPTQFDVNGVSIGGNSFNMIAGPCSVENEDQIFQIAEFLHKHHIRFIRGGAYKPRTSPYAFQGLKKEGLKLLRKAADAYNLNVVTEVMDVSLIDEVSEYSDIMQVGSRNMSNFYLLSHLGKIKKPILLKRGMAAKIPEWLMAAEYVLSGGNEKVILCERGIRTFDDTVRNTLDIAAFPIIKELSHLPVFSDPSHGTGNRDRVIPMALASVAAGCDGLMIEVHPNPENAMSDGPQSLYPHQFESLLPTLKTMVQSMGRVMDCEVEGQLI